MAGIVPQRFPIGNDTTLSSKLIHSCAPKHWDPTMIYRYTNPQTVAIELPTDPRPWTKVCLEYVNSGRATEQAPAVPPSFLVPGASEFYPPTRYQQAIDQESLLRRLDRPLNDDLLPGGCYPNQFTLSKNSDVFQQQSLLPPYEPPKSKMVRELESPAALKQGQYDCSKEAMLCDISATPRFWNNHTKLAKYNQREGSCGNTLWQYKDGKQPSADNLPRPVPRA